MAPIATSDLSDYYPAPFPKGLATVELTKVSLKRLLDGDAATQQQIFDALCNDGFFYLDLTTDPLGRDFTDLSAQLHDAARDVFNNVPIQTKETYAGEPPYGFLDKGYRPMGKDATGEPRVAEALMVPTNDLLHDPSMTLPSWLEPYQPAYRAFAACGSAVAQALFRVLDSSLHLPEGTLTEMHRISDETQGFVRMFRYPAPASSPADAADEPKCVGPSHTDGNSLTLLFNWQGGLQISAYEAARGVHMVDAADARDAWRWVVPEPGHVLVNLGDPMVVLSNGVLKNGRHRVMTPPGAQARFHRYSVLQGVRCKADTPMRALQSDVIPPETPAQREKEATTSREWVLAKVRGILERADTGKG